jgi:hypothetical protein
MSETSFPSNASVYNIRCEQQELRNLAIQLCSNSDYIITKFCIFTVSVITVLTFKKITIQKHQLDALFILKKLYSSLKHLKKYVVLVKKPLKMAQ